MAKKKLPNSDDNLASFKSVSPDLKRENNRSLVDELYKKNWQKTTIDNFEKSMGYGPKPASPESDVIFDNKLFEMEYDKDKKIFNELMNNPEYKIIFMKDSWTVDGKFRIFVIYSKKIKDKEKEPTDE